MSQTRALALRAVWVTCCRAAKTLVYRATLPYSGVSQLCILEPTTATVKLAGSYTLPGDKNTSYSIAQVRGPVGLLGGRFIASCVPHAFESGRHDLSVLALFCRL